MYLLPLAFIVAIALVVWFIFVSDASLVAKVIVGILFVISFFLHPSAFPLAGFFLRIAISLLVMLYQMFQVAKSQ
jgi:hypothetical protein